MNNVFNRTTEPWVRPWNVKKFDNLYNRDERFFSIVVKGMLSWLNRNIVLYDKSIKHFIFNTGSSYLYMESNGYEFDLSETTGEDTMYMTLPRCLIEIGDISFPTEELTSPFARGNYERRNGNMLCGYNAEIRRLPIEMTINARYYLSNFNETLILLQELIDKLVYQQYFNISYLGQVIQCSIEFPSDVNPEINKVDMSSADPNQRNITLGLKVCVNYPIINVRTEIPTDKIIVAFGVDMNLMNKSYTSDNIKKGTIMQDQTDDYDKFIEDISKIEKEPSINLNDLDELIIRYDTNNDGILDEKDIEKILSHIKYDSGDPEDGNTIKYDHLTNMIHTMNSQEGISVEFDSLTNSIYVTHVDDGITYAIALNKYKIQK